MCNSSTTVLDRSPTDSEQCGNLLTIRSRLENANILVEIEDHGEGLPDALSERIFEPFFTTKEGGMGIGLSISQRIVREHGGEITVAPTPQGGATFRVSLPVR